METFKLTYEINRNEKYLLILGENFYLNNRLYCLIIHKNKVYHLKGLKPIIPIKDIKEDILTLKIIFLEKIENINSMFFNCKSLLTFTRKENKIKSNEEDRKENKIGIKIIFKNYHDNQNFGNDNDLEYDINEKLNQNINKNFLTILNKDSEPEITTISEYKEKYKLIEAFIA